ncbi:RcpC/CpaB family pilus assembly protein [Brevibacillus dissolubilis]|uniref:RcpC/CpaB family pilus assembly protein n=1 Tax=Brevibacillus dissolubilis TaxID=1844116 RepID=UPI0011176634|nr:RcpC/CpaB family pilus assembly protein [Brevibacillus dissolubilis]
MPSKTPVIHPIRLIAALIFALAVALGSYHLLKPHTFTYVKLRDDVNVEGGMPLLPEQVEQAVLTLGGLFPDKSPPLPGLIAWEDTAKLDGLTFARSLKGGVPLMWNDLNIKGQSSLDESLHDTQTGISIPVDNITGISPHLTAGDRVHIYASFENEAGAHTGLLLKEMPIIALQREMDGEVPQLTAVTIALQVNEAVLLTHALHYGKIRLSKAPLRDGKVEAGIGDYTFASALLKTNKRWSDGEGAE